jgi:hypothetical protein
VLNRHAKGKGANQGIASTTAISGKSRTEFQKHSGLTGTRVRIVAAFLGYRVESCQKGTLLDASSKDGHHGNPTIRDALAMVSRWMVDVDRGARPGVSCPNLTSTVLGRIV